MARKSKKGLAIIAAVFAGALGLSFALKGCMGGAEEALESSLGGSAPKNLLKLGRKSRGEYIAVLHVEGVIQDANRDYNQAWLLDTIDELAEDDSNRGIMLFIDSPGGTVYESDEAYLALLDYKAETDRPVYAYMGKLAASGGYYIACAADYIFANRNTLTGSIGVIAGQTVDATGLMEKIGVKMRTFTAGRNKNMGGLDSPLTEEQAAIFQSIADDAYAQFTQIVAESREIDIARVEELADGRIYTARQAKEAGLIDEICRFDEAEDYIEDAMEEDVDFIDYKYEYTESLADLLGIVRTLSEPPRTEARLEYMLR